MVITPYKHSYATQKLLDNKIKIFINKKQILQYPLKEINWDFPKLETTLTIGNTLSSGGHKFKIIESYEDLIGLGFQITIKKTSGKFFKGQRVQYLIVKRNSTMYDVGLIPRGHYIEYDIVERKIRIRGKNCDGKWVLMQKKRDMQPYSTQVNPFDSGKFMDTYQEFMKRYNNMPMEEDDEIITIPELAAGISEDNKLVCIPDDKDMPVIAYLGMRGYGKSMGMHGLADRIFHKWNKSIIWANDVLRESGTWCLPWNNTNFINQLERIGESTQPLPMVYLHPSTRDLKFLMNNETSFKISLPFKEAMSEYHLFLQGKKDWELEKSGTYFRNLLLNDDGDVREDGLLNCKSFDEMKSLILKQEEKEIQEDVKGQLVVRKYTGYVIENEKVRYKLMNVLKDICNTQIFDITNGIHPKWTIELPDGKHIYHPWIACLIAGLVPSIVTSDLRNKEFYPQYIRFVFNDIFKFQTEDEIAFKNKSELYIFVDEIAGIVNDITKEILSRMVREGRPARIGFAYASQNIDKVPDDIKLNTNYVFAFRQKKVQANLISRDFDLLNYKEKELIRLGKFECLGIGKLVTYGIDGEREVVTDEPIKMTILPSVSMHQAPKITGEE